MVSQAFFKIRKVAYAGTGVICIAVVSISIAPCVFANPRPSGLAVSPAIEQITLQKNQDSTEFNAQVTNNTGSPASVTISTSDFTSTGEIGQLSFVPGGRAAHHGLSDWIHVSPAQLSLSPGQSRTVPVTISNANALAPGGHYAALIYKVTSEPNSGGNTVTIGQAVSTLIFLTTYSQGTTGLRLEPVPLPNITTTLPSTINIVLANTGNTQSVPRGYVQVTNKKGEVLTQAIINANSGMILPGGKRLFTIALKDISSPPLVTHYTVKIFYRHDGQSSYQQYAKRITVIDVRLAVVCGIILMLIAAMLTKLFWLLFHKPGKKMAKKNQTEEKTASKKKRHTIDVKQL